MKSELIRCFLHRAKLICVDEKDLQTEIVRLRKTFWNNGYSKAFFDKILDDFFKGKSEQQKTDNEAILPIIIKVPYIGKPSILFAKRLKNLLRTKLNTVPPR